MFQNFPIVDYKFGDNDKSTQFVNLSAYSSVFDQIADSSSFYSYYTIQNGDRPDVISHKLYGTSEYYWTLWLLNTHIRASGWPLSDTELVSHALEQYPGQCLVCFGTMLSSDSDNVSHILLEKFALGSRVYGTESGSIGVVYGRNLNLGQLFVNVVSGSGFVRNELISDSASDASYTVAVDIVHDPAYLAVHHVEDGDGIHVDVDYSSDFRGRGPEDPSALGGVVGDDEHPDVYSDQSPYSVVTIWEYMQNLNADLSRIRVVKPALIGQFAQFFKKSMR